ncbi:MAG: hypothetical protein SGJ27_20935 [Candidatus Melainabacteria bacterium]|nr:hypothetical protein [Candidatus Melainabacteria bacterium]
MSDEDKQNATQSEEEALLKRLTETEVQKEQVVAMVGDLVGMLGRMGGQNGFMMPKAGAATAPSKQREPQKNIKHISERLTEAAQTKNLDCIRNDEHFMQWLNREGCKLKNFHDELGFARQTIELAFENGDFDLGLLAATKAINIGNLHAKRDREMLSELYWAQAEIYASVDRMTEATQSLKSCVQLINPGATEQSDAYTELLQQLEETRQKTHALTT